VSSRKTKTTVAIACMSLFLILASCGLPLNQKPSEEVARTAIQKYLLRKVPQQFGEQHDGVGWPGGNGQLEQFKLVRVGDYNSENKYWPVEASGNGKYDLCCDRRGYRGQFKFLARFKIFKDDFGQWAAEFY
jgi:hypothetical protein